MPQSLSGKFEEEHFLTLPVTIIIQPVVFLILPTVPSGLSLSILSAIPAVRVRTMTNAHVEGCLWLLQV